MEKKYNLQDYLLKLLISNTQMFLLTHKICMYIYKNTLKKYQNPFQNFSNIIVNNIENKTINIILTTVANIILNMIASEITNKMANTMGTRIMATSMTTTIATTMAKTWQLQLPISLQTQ